MILVFGSQGQLGHALQDAIGEAPAHIFLSRDSRDHCGDITNTAGITETLMDLKPEIIINAAAYTALEAGIAGVAGRHKDAVRAMASDAEAKAYDWSPGWPGQ